MSEPQYDGDDMNRMQEFDAGRYVTIPRAQYEALRAAASEATIAWACCASLHREYAKNKDPFYTTRQADFVKHEEAARAAFRAAGIQREEEA